MSQIHTLHRTGWLILLGFTLGVLYSKITSSYSPEDSRNFRDAQFPQEDGPSSHADRIGDAGDADPTTSLEAVDSGDGRTAQTLPSTSDAEDDSETPKLKYFASPAPTSQASVLFAQDIAGANDDGADGHALTPVSGLAGLVIDVPTPVMASDLVAPGAPRLGPVQLPMIRTRRLPNVGPGDPLACVQTDLPRSSPSGAGSTRPVNRMDSSRLDTPGTSRQRVGPRVILPMSYPWDLNNQSNSYSSAPNRYTGSSTPRISKPFLYSQAGITIEQYTSDRFTITIMCGNGNPDVGSLRDILKRHFPEHGLLSLKLNLFLTDSLDEMCYGREILEKILVHASPILHILHINVPSMGKFTSQLTVRRLDDIAFPVLKSFVWSGRFKKTFFNPVLSLPTLPFHQLTTLELNGALAVDDCINILHRCSSISMFVVDRLESVDAVCPVETQILEGPKRLDWLCKIKLAASPSVDVRPLLEQVDLSMAEDIVFEVPSRDSMLAIVAVSWRYVQKAMLVGPADSTILEKVRCLQQADSDVDWQYVPRTRE